MHNSIDPLELLARTDKWTVGGGAATMYAPSFPKQVDTPGYWDEAYFADIRLERLFGIMVLDEAGAPVRLSRAVRRWRPDRLTQIYALHGQPGVMLVEERVVTRSNVFSTRLSFTTSEPETVRLNLMMWSMQPAQTLTTGPQVKTRTNCSDVKRSEYGISYTHQIRYGSDPEAPADVYGWGTKSSTGRTRKRPANSSDPDGIHSLYVTMAADRLPESGAVHLCETTDTAPLYELSVFPEKFQNGMLRGEHAGQAGWNQDGLVHLALHYNIRVRPNETERVTFGAGVALSPERAARSLVSAMSGDVVQRSTEDWYSYFDSVPLFECSDPYLQTAYWYRWYGLRLHTVDFRNDMPAHVHTCLPGPCVFEGPDRFRNHISYSAQCHARETSWMQDRAVAMGSIENFFASQNTDSESEERGAIPGHLMMWRRGRGFYHTDWGTAALQIYHLTNDEAFVRRVYPGMARYADYCERIRDADGSGMIDVCDQGETGQEYMSRYLFASESADQWHPFRIKGIDATCYIFSLYSTLSVFAGIMEFQGEAQRWKRLADKTRLAVRETMWDSSQGIFKDVDPETHALSPYAAAVGFYPLLYGITTEQQLVPMLNQLSNADRFGTPYGIPGVPVNDPYFDESGSWKGKRTNCPWNGRVWPMASSHVADGLARVARQISSRAIPEAREFLNRYIRMLFFEGDVKRPNCFEHYNPRTGKPSLYRGIDDYQHSWIVDLIIRHAAGVQPEPGPRGGVVIDPLPFDIEQLNLQRVPVRGHLIGLRWGYGDGFVVTVDGKVRARLDKPQKVEINLNARK